MPRLCGRRAARAVGIPGRQRRGLQASPGQADRNEGWGSKSLLPPVHEMPFPLPCEIAFLPLFWLRLLVPPLLTSKE